LRGLPPHHIAAHCAWLFSHRSEPRCEGADPPFEFANIEIAGTTHQVTMSRLNVFSGRHFQLIAGGKHRRISEEAEQINAW